MKHLLPIFLFLLLFIGYSCDNDDEDEQEEVKISNFSSPEEFIENPSVSQAIAEASITIYEGNNPPALAGDYLADGEVTDVSDYSSGLDGVPINSQITLYNQTSAGRINFREKIQGITVWGSGGYVTGDNGRFTIWQESRQTGSEAGLPDDITINVALIMSGIKQSNGDLTAWGLSVVTKVEADENKYNVDLIKGFWWMWEADMELIGPATVVSNSKVTIEKNLLFDFINPTSK